MKRRLAPLAAAALFACRPAAPTGPVAASLIAPSAPTRIGLVRLDGTGAVLPALALRWAVLEGGRDYLFRIDDAPGRPSATTIARRLRAILAERRPLRAAVPVAVETVAAVTPTVVELRLAAPQPDLLLLLARPPFLFAPARSPSAAIVHVERAGRAVARFRAGATAFVTGGTFADLPVAEVAGLDPALIRFDPATGLFGFAPVAGGPGGDPALLRALDLALDRVAMVEDMAAPGLVAAAPGEGGDAPLAARVSLARALVARRGGPPPPLRVAMPPGPGARLLFAHAAADWRRIGVTAIAVAPDAPADLALVDRTWPAAGVARLACAVSAGCDPRQPGSGPFLAIATPVRWSLVSRRLAGFTANPLASHPLDELRLAP